MDLIRSTLAQALAQGRMVLLEHELLALLEHLGCTVPAFQFLPATRADTPAIEPTLIGRAGVVKVVSPGILHKTDVGGVRFLDRIHPEAVAEAARAIMGSLTDTLRDGVQGFVLEERVDYTSGLGHELLLGLRHTSEFGEVFTVGLGGTYVEALNAAMQPGEGTVLFHADLCPREKRAEKLGRALFFRWISGQVRGVPALAGPQQHLSELSSWIEALSALSQAIEASGQSLAECELNPLVWAGHWIPVDALLRLGPARTPRKPFPIERLKCAIHPRSMAIVGVSTRMNMGRIILRSMLDAGFPSEQLTVVRPDVSEIDGVRAVPCIAAIEGPVDLLVLAISAQGVPEALKEALSTGAARSILLVSGGMGETEGGKGIEEQVLELLDGQSGNRRPVLIGNNSLGLISQADRTDTLFIPKEKLPRVRQGRPNIALISQSGAYMITRVSKLDHLNPAYQISAGNQIDARISDFMEALRDDPQVHTFALYIEGFREHDGQRMGELTRELVAEGRDVIAYKGGRSRLGQTATAGHTASVAGDYRVFCEVMADSGAIVANSFDEFLDLLEISATLQHRSFSGKRVAMVSNAGFETVGMADNHQGPGFALTPARFEENTRQRIARALEEAHIAHLVNVSNPLDLTPMANDEVHESCIRAILDDPGVDAGVFCNVPLTPSIQSLPPGLHPRDVFDSNQGYARRVIAVFREVAKPMIFVIDAGRHYDLMFHFMRQQGLPVFRSADQAIRTLGHYLTARSK